MTDDHLYNELIGKLVKVEIIQHSDRANANYFGKLIGKDDISIALSPGGRYWSEEEIEKSSIFEVRIRSEVHPPNLESLMLVSKSQIKCVIPIKH